jgi:cytochrome c-type biogenesis protein CcmH/NrfG
VRVFTLFLLALPSLFGEGALSKAEDLYHRTDYQASMTLIRESGQATAEACYLLGKDYFMLGDFKKAAEAFGRAFNREPGNAGYALWLGRSYGRRAEISSPFSASRYASKAREYFEKAVALDPTSEEALNDLFDYYLEAPGFLGDGYNQAEEIAKRIGARDPAQGIFAETRLAEQRKQFHSSEEELRRAIDFAPGQVGRVLDLARYLARHGRFLESEAAFKRAERLAPNSPKIIFARALTYIQQKRNLDQAKALLNQYLKSDLSPDDPSREQAEKLLKEASGV